ncbi:MAG: hypothetical protein C5B50_06455 [Verrucomicrobia bacterium]|nr:MAG: hypothetical protein C5B50_06455 [Verrucomicrobiota bacterium]
MQAAVRGFAPWMSQARQNGCGAISYGLWAASFCKRQPNTTNIGASKHKFSPGWGEDENFVANFVQNFVESCSE